MKVSNLLAGSYPWVVRLLTLLIIALLSLNLLITADLVVTGLAFTSFNFQTVTNNAEFEHVDGTNNLHFEIDMELPKFGIVNKKAYIIFEFSFFENGRTVYHLREYTARPNANNLIIFEIPINPTTRNQLEVGFRLTVTLTLQVTLIYAGVSLDNLARIIPIGTYEIK